MDCTLITNFLCNSILINLGELDTHIPRTFYFSIGRKKAQTLTTRGAPNMKTTKTKPQPPFKRQQQDQPKNNLQRQRQTTKNIINTNKRLTTKVKSPQRLQTYSKTSEPKHKHLKNTPQQPTNLCWNINQSLCTPLFSLNKITIFLSLL